MTADTNLTRIIDAFSKAAEHCEIPGLSIMSALGRNVNFVRADPAKVNPIYPGSMRSVFVFVDEEFSAVIKGQDGRCIIRHAVSEQHPGLAGFLNRLNEDFAGTLAHLGRERGSCQFCHRELKDRRSTQAGYGPTCATRWGLPWGDAS